MLGHSTIDIRDWISVFYAFQYSINHTVPLWKSVWISMDIYGYPCMGLLWVLDSGSGAYRN